MDIERELLLALYRAYFSPGFDLDVYALAEQEEWDITFFRNLIKQLKDKDLITDVSTRSFMLTPPGVIYSEQNHIPPSEDIQANERARTLILSSLATVYEEKGYHQGLSNEVIAEQTKLSKELITSNLYLLGGAEYVEQFGNMPYQITTRGYESVKEYRSRKGIGEEFDEISKLSPQPRGRALQKILGKIIEQNGWKQEESVKTSHEEMDVIVFKQREFYLVECKWEKDPIEAKVIRELFGKLGNRVDVRGIVVSMSGFTKGAVEQAEDYVGQKVVLLFGKNSVELLIYGQTTFDNLLDQKYKELIMRKKILFD